MLCYVIPHFSYPDLFDVMTYSNWLAAKSRDDHKKIRIFQAFIVYVEVSPLQKKHPWRAY